jgi:hypothetical protein
VIRQQGIKDIKYSWMEKWQGPERILTYLEQTVNKSYTIEQYRSKLLTGNLFSQIIQLSAFLNPVTFLNAHRQSTSRKCKY